MGMSPLFAVGRTGLCQEFWSQLPDVKLPLMRRSPMPADRPLPPLAIQSVNVRNAIETRR